MKIWDQVYYVHWEPNSEVRGGLSFMVRPGNVISFDDKLVVIVYNNEIICRLKTQVFDNHFDALKLKDELQYKSASGKL